MNFIDESSKWFIIFKKTDYLVGLNKEAG